MLGVVVLLKASRTWIFFFFFLILGESGIPIQEKSDRSLKCRSKKKSPILRSVHQWTTVYVMSSYSKRFPLRKSPRWPETQLSEARIESEDPDVGS